MIHTTITEKQHVVFKQIKLGVNNSLDLANKLKLTRFCVHSRIVNLLERGVIKQHETPNGRANGGKTKYTYSVTDVPFTIGENYREKIITTIAMDTLLAWAPPGIRPKQHEKTA